MFENENNSEFASHIEIIIVSKEASNLEVLLHFKVINKSKYFISFSSFFELLGFCCCCK
jgi:hypothetical protein